MVLVESILFIAGMAALVSGIDFIAKTTSNVTHSFGIPEYLASTVILSFILAFPVSLILLISNMLDIPAIGLSSVIGFTTATISLILGYFLIKNKVSVVYERYRNATFMWAAAVLFLIVSSDRFIDRVDAAFLLALFVFYLIYVYYRTGKSKEHTYLKKIKFNIWLYPISLIVVIISAYIVVATTASLSASFNLNPVVISMTVIGLVLALPFFDVMKSVFGESHLTFDTILGTVVVSLTLLPAIVAFINPIPLFLGGRIEIMPILILNVLCLSVALSTRLFTNVHKKTGILLIIGYIVFLAYLFFG